MGGPGTGGRLVTLPLAWLAGVALQLRERELMTLDVYVALAVIALVGAAALLRLPRARRYALVAVVGVLGGFASAGWQASLRIAETFPSAIEGQDIVVSGVVASLPQQGPSGLRFRFVVDAGSAPAGVPATLALGWYAGYH